MNGREEITAIILAGGKSSRMGTDKGLMQYKGVPMITHVLDTVEELTSRIIIIANNPTYEALGYPVFPDLVTDKGPLAGVVTGLTHTLTDKNLILTCDTPHVSSALLKDLIDVSAHNEVVIPVYDEKQHPLIAIYRKSALKHLKEQLALSKLKMMKAVEGVKVNHWNADHHDPSNFININSAADL